MTGKQLKNSILQLAIQGKLVPQDPHDEPASELLKRIRKEKEQLVKTGKLKKKDLESTPIAEDEKPFEIPESWVWCKMNDLAIYRKGPFGSSLTKAMFVPKGNTTVKVYEQKNAIQKDWKLGDYYITSEKYHSMESFLVSPNDIIVSCAGTIGECYQLPAEAPFGIINQALMRVCLFIPKMAKYWMLFFADMLNHNTAMKGAGSAIKNIPPFEVLKNILVPIPPLEEQYRIVERFEELMPLVEEYDKAQSELDKLNESLPEQLKKSILQQAIMGKLVPQDPNDEPASELLKRIHKEKENLVKSGALKKKDLITTPISEEEKSFDIPESWEWVRIGEIADITNGFTPLRTNPQFWNEADIPWFTVDDIRNQGRKIRYTNQKISQNALAKDSTRIVPEGSLLLCCTASVGEYALALIPLTTNQQFNAISIKSNYKKLVSSDYLFAIAPTFKNRLLSMAGKTTFNFVSVKKVSELIIPLPPLSEQHRIVAKIEELFSILK